MKQEVTDSFGTYTVNTKNKPEELKNATAIYLNIFDNEGKKNACRYNIVLSAVNERGKPLDWHCPILNHYEPARWLRQVPENFIDAPFYRQMQAGLNDFKKQDVKFEKKPSAGFFKMPRHKGMPAEHRPNILNAIAFMLKEENETPYVAMRFMDLYWDGYLEETFNNRGPKWSICLTSSKMQGLKENANYDDYF